ncbi:PAS domain-containing sensor histidine kinase [Pseudothauera rhizosphaerae]|uniref:Oxygen sensor histidine kinase NreB n=1 Tax=Pseudothauera rhizosphaerae TaxID=2565932 RepID=A0A4S4AYX5_9RHOO|nr:PAS domain-containing protein [Pseudothauera rhizosphaerae]THF65366.1 PAS domain S-box protein [Pseudothauera rhizosphaerae]
MTSRSPAAVPSPGRLALAIALIYAALATGWIIHSDRLLAVWARDAAMLTELQTWKGLFFVLSTAILLWLMIRFGFSSMLGLQGRLADREAVLQVALRATRVGLWDYRVGRAEIGTDETVARMLGHEPETFRETIAAWLDRVHPDDLAEVRLRFRNYLEGLAPDYVCEYRMRLAGGGYRWFRASGEIVEHDGDGRPTRVIGTYLDIHEQVEAYRRLAEGEARARLYLERIPIGCMVTDTDWRILECNPAFERMFGFPAEELAGRSAFDTIIPASARAQTEIILARLRQGVFDGHDVNENLTRDGRRILCEWFTTPIRDGDGRVVKFLAMAIDISAREAADRALADSHRQLAELSARLLQIQEEERGRLARELHDEIGQELTAVGFDLRAIGQEALGDAARARLEDCERIVDRSITRIRNRALALRPTMLDDLGLGPALAWYCRGQAERSGVPVALGGAEGLPRLAEAAETAAFRIVQESVDNALRHGAPSRVEVALALDDGVLELRVDDDGCGFAPGEAEGGRTSLGLAGMRERAELAGGHFELQSAPGAGTHVLARLPAAARAAT